MPSLFGYEVESDLPLRRLNQAPGTRGRLVVETTTERLFDPAETAHTVRDPDGRLFLAAAERDGGCVVHMPPTATFLLRAGEPLRIAVKPGDGGDGLLEHRLVSAAACMLLSMHGDVVLHASAVEVEGQSVVFCGETWRGKSTLARVLGERGHPVLSEDGIAISLSADRPTAYPGARGVRVRRAGGGGTPELVPDPGPNEPSPSPLSALVVLEARRQSLSVEPLQNARALALLTSHLVHTGERDSIAASFRGLASLLHSVPAAAVSLPDDLSALPRAAQKMLDTLPGRG
jgi:hypothetical protein